MKKLILIRHGKSEWNGETLPDFERPLNKRGKRDCPVMAQRMVEANIMPERWISSTAKRARETVEIMNKVFALDEKRITWSDRLYLASPAEIAEVIAREGGEASTLFLTGHNPGISELAAAISGVRLDNIPTCGIFGVQAEIENWSEINTKRFTFDFFDYPKKSI